GAMTSEQRVRSILDLGATVLLSTPTYALRLADVARGMGVDLADSSVRVTIHAGEPGASISATRDAIEAAWSASSFDHTGMTELGPTGFSCSARDGVHLIESEFIFEVTDEGELVATNLGRWGMPHRPRFVATSSPSSVTSKMNSDSIRCTPSRAEQLNPVGPSSVIPVRSNAEADHAASMAPLVSGIEAPGSPAWIVTRTDDSARSTLMPRATSARRSAYVGVDRSTVAPRSRMVRTRCSLVIEPPDLQSAPSLSATPEADQDPMNGPNEKARNTRSAGVTDAAR